MPGPDYAPVVRRGGPDPRYGAQDGKVQRNAKAMAAMSNRRIVIHTAQLTCLCCMVGLRDS